MPRRSSRRDRLKSFSEVFEEESDIDFYGNPKGHLGPEIFDSDEESESKPAEEVKSK